LEQNEGAGFQIKPDGQIEAQLSRLLSLAFKNFNIKGEFDWALRAEGNFIAINCLDYSGGWKEIWPKVQNFLNLTVNKLISTENPLESIALQYIDRFIYEGQIEWYKTSTIFNNESPYLNKKVTGSGPLWNYLSRDSGSKRFFQYS